MKRSKVEFDDVVVDQIRNKFDNKEYELALSLITERINTRQGDEQYQALLIRAEFYYQLKRWPEALNDTQNILQREPRSVVGLGLHLKCLLKQGKVDEALVYLNRIIEIDPNNRKALVGRGSLLIIQNKLDEALADFNGIISTPIKDKCFVAALRGAGAIYERRGHLTEAWEHFDRALELVPDDRFVLERRALLYKQSVDQIRNKFDNKEYELALSLITKLINTRQSNEQHQALLIRAEFYYQLKRWPEALNDTQNILQREPRSVVGVGLHLKCLLKQGKVDEVLAALGDPLNRAIERDPNNRSALVSRGLLLVKQNKLDEALADFNSVISTPIKDNCFVDALRSAGVIYERRGHLTEAREHLDRALELVPDNRSVLAQQALLSKQQSNLEESGHDKAQVLANFASAKSHGGNNFQQAPHFFGAKSSVAQVDTYPPQDDEVNDQDTGTKFAQQPS